MRRREAVVQVHFTVNIAPETIISRATRFNTSIGFWPFDPGVLLKIPHPDQVSRHEWMYILRTRILLYGCLVVDSLKVDDRLSCHLSKGAP